MKVGLGGCDPEKNVTNFTFAHKTVEILRSLIGTTSTKKFSV
jgi:hypothetical protein